MRIIDADELRKKIVARVVHGEDKIDRGFNLGIGAALDLLNVAPTVEPEKAKESEIIKAYTKGFNTAVEIARTEADDELDLTAITSKMCGRCKYRNEFEGRPRIDGSLGCSKWHYLTNELSTCSSFEPEEGGNK